MDPRWDRFSGSHSLVSWTVSLPSWLLRCPARRSHLSLASYSADSTHIPSIWASQPLEISAGGLLDPKADRLAMEMYRDIVRDMSVELDDD